MAKLKDILQQQRKKNFVGRQKETSFFEQLLKEQEPSVHLIYVYGPGGQGKTKEGGRKSYGHNLFKVLAVTSRFVREAQESAKFPMDFTLTYVNRWLTDKALRSPALGVKAR